MLRRLLFKPRIARQTTVLQLYFQQSIMFLRLVLICLAFFVAVHAQPAPGAPQYPKETLPVDGTLLVPSADVNPADGAKPRTLLLLLPLLFPDQFY
ncbi:uncharacterized protein [Drosophila pseudoobscura]|uniref:Uncharacterized protein n=1 Tax=Drosophila pseudoobscura pseudoobscura TaxID=46245 RepID=A0A6I8VDF1_DROPS|nr:uncharacterized protein LOC26533395 [Drosophila pseudoobscura]